MVACFCSEISDIHPGKIPPGNIYRETQKLKEHHWNVIKQTFGCVVNDESLYLLIEKPEDMHPLVKKPIESSSLTTTVNDNSIQSRTVAQTSMSQSSEVQPKENIISRYSPHETHMPSTVAPQASSKVSNDVEKESFVKIEQPSFRDASQILSPSYTSLKAADVRQRLLHMISFNSCTVNYNSYKVELEEFPNFSHVNAVLQCLTHLKRIQNYFLRTDSPLYKGLQPALLSSMLINSQIASKREKGELDDLVESFVKMLVAFSKGDQTVYSHFDLLSQLSSLHAGQLNIQRADVATFFRTFTNDLDKFLCHTGLVVSEGFSFPTERTTGLAQQNINMVSDTFDFSIAVTTNCSNCIFEKIDTFFKRVLTVSLPPATEPFTFYLVPQFCSTPNYSIIEVTVFLDPKRTSVKHLLALSKNYMPSVPQYRWRCYLLAKDGQEMIYHEENSILETLPEDKIVYFYECGESSSRFAYFNIQKQTGWLKKKAHVDIVIPPLLLPAYDSNDSAISSFIEYLEEFGTFNKKISKNKEHPFHMKVKLNVTNWEEETFNKEFYTRRGVFEQLTQKRTKPLPGKNSMDLANLLKNHLEERTEDVSPQCEQCEAFDTVSPKCIPIPKTWPPVLVIHLNRFPQSFTNFPSYRNPMAVKCPERLSVMDFSLSFTDKVKPDYQLVAFVSLHDKIGQENSEYDHDDDNGAGVFTATCRVRDRTKATSEYIWYRFENGEVKPVPFETSDAVLLFYEDINDQAAEDNYLDEVD
jgi:hypothetical protein